MKIVVTGAGGQLGHDLLRAFDEPRYEVVACDHGRLDVANRDAVMQAITTTRPDAVVHAAAWTDVDGCETDPDRAFAVNALGTRHVAEATRLIGARVCFVSTDYVFDGTATTPYREWDATNPLSMYGRSKLGGERELGPDDAIVRTSWVCGVHGKNFVRTMLRLAAERETVDVVTDQHGQPTWSHALAEQLVALGEAAATGRAAPGVYHGTAGGETTWYGLARAVFAEAGLDPARVRPVTSAQFPRPAARPTYSVLGHERWSATGVPALPGWRRMLTAALPHLLALAPTAGR